MKRRDFARAGLAAVAASVAGCGAIDSVLDAELASPQLVETWGTYRGDTRRTGRVPAEEGPGESLSVAWQVTGTDVIEQYTDLELSELVFSPDAEPSWPILVDDLVIWMVGWTGYTDIDPDRRRISGKRVFAADTSGSIEWSRELTASGGDADLTSYGPRLDDDEVFQPNGVDGTLEVSVFDPETGIIKRDLDLGVTNRAGLVVGDGTIYAADPGGDRVQLSAFDAETGTEEWSVRASTHSRYPFAALEDGSLLYFARADGYYEIVERNADDGTVAWRTPLDLPVPDGSEWPMPLAPPTLVDGGIYAAGGTLSVNVLESSPLVSLDAEDGTERYQYVPPGFDDGDDSGADGDATANERSTAESPPFSALYGFPLVLDDLVVVTGIDDPNAEVDHLCFAIDENGSLVWSLDIGAAFAPVAAGDVIYLTTGRGVATISSEGERLDSIQPEMEGEKVTIPRYFQSPALGNGQLYVPFHHGLVAFE